MQKIKRYALAGLLALGLVAIAVPLLTPEQTPSSKPPILPNEECMAAAKKLANSGIVVQGHGPDYMLRISAKAFFAIGPEQRQILLQNLLCDKVGHLEIAQGKLTVQDTLSGRALAQLKSGPFGGYEEF